MITIKKKTLGILVLLLVFVVSFAACEMLEDVVDDALDGSNGNGYGNVTGVVEDENGHPVPGASVSLGDKNDVTDGNGIFNIDEISSGHYTLVVTQDGYKTNQQQLNVSSGHNSVGTITLVAEADGTGVIPGIVTDTEGRVLEDVIVSIDDKNDITGSSGLFNIDGLEVGSATITFRKDGYQVVERNINIQEGSNQMLEIEMREETEDKDFYEIVVEVLEGQGEVQLIPDKEEYEEGDEVIITAQAAEGYEFDSWRGALSGTDRIKEVVVDSNMTIGAVFVQTEDTSDRHTLTLSTDGGGSTIPSEGSYDYDEGDIVKLFAYPAEGLEFSHWQGDVDDMRSTETDVTMNNDKEVVAVFEEKTLEIIHVSNIDRKTIEYGTDFSDLNLPNRVEVILEDNSTEELDVDWNKGSYDGQEAGTYKIYGDLILKDKITNPEELSATIEITVQEEGEEIYTLSINIEGKGTVTPSEGTHDYKEGEKVSVEALPEEGWIFDKWSGDIDSSELRENIIMNEDKDITAEFKEEEEEADTFILNIKTEGEGKVEPEEGVHQYNEGEEVSLKATPKEGWEFSNWTGDIFTVSPETNITMDENKEVVAIFNEIEDGESEDIYQGNIINDFSGHTTTVNSLQFSSDNSKVLSASRDNTVKIWNSNIGNVITDFDEHTDSVVEAVFSSDDSMAASASWDNTVKVWNADTGAIITDFTEHTGSVYSIDFSSDDSMVVSGSADNTLKVWNTETGEVIAENFAHGNNVNSVAFSSDDSLVVSASDDGTVKIWDIEAGQIIINFTEHDDNVNSVAFSSDDNLILSASSDNTAKIWNAKTGEVITNFEYDYSVNSASFSSDDSMVASVEEWSYNVYVWDAITGKKIINFEKQSAYPYSVTFSSDDSMIASGDSRGNVLIWD